MADQVIWQIEPHTLAKHEILKRYLGAWFPILGGGNHGRVVFLDGFAGPGRYAGGEPGSPLIALNTLVQHSYFPKLSATEFVFIFVESSGERVTSLELEIAQFWKDFGAKPANIVVEVIHSTFHEAANRLLAEVEGKGSQIAPTFAFVDPFGYKGIPMSTLRRLLSHRRTEVFINFMFDSANRFIGDLNNTANQRNYRELFGTDAYLGAVDHGGQGRRNYLHELYASQLKRAGCEHVRHFEMFRDDGHLVYSLFFGTKHELGLKVMKEAMWKLDPVDGMRFSDRLAGEMFLFDPEPDFRPLRAAILERFGDKHAVPIEEVERFVLLDTQYRETHYKKQVLKPLQDEGLIKVFGQKRRGTYPPGTIIRFE